MLLDAVHARLLLERVIPPMKAIEMAAPLTLPDGTLTDQGRAVLAAVGAGELAPAQGAQLLAGLGALARIVETDELEKRIRALEERAMRNLEARVSRMEAAAPADLLLVHIVRFSKPAERGVLCASVGSRFVNRETTSKSRHSLSAHPRGLGALAQSWWC